MDFDLSAVETALDEHDIQHSRVPADSASDSIERLELDDGLAVTAGDRWVLTQNVEGTRHTRGRYTRLDDLIDWIRDYQALNG